MKDIIQELKILSERIEEAKHKKASCEGRQLEILKQLKENYGVDTIEKAEGFLDESQKKIDILLLKRIMI